MKKVLSSILIASVMLSVVGLFSACQKNKQKFTNYYFDYFDTSSTIIGYEETKEDFSKVCKEIEAQLKEYHQLFDIYKKYDGVNNLCVVNELENGQHKEIKVDKKIIDLLLFSKEMYNLTEGKTNIAMGSVLSLWHDSRTYGLDHPENAKLPDEKLLKEASKHIDIDDVIINEESSTVYLKDPKLTLDVGAIAKGYAVEKIAKWLENEGVSGYVLNVGGNVRAVGKQYGGTPWKTGIENPDNNNEKEPYIAYLNIENEAVVTSGSYQRFYEVNGKKFHHIIDSETLYPASKFAAVSVVCKDSGKADALSTALFLMDLEDGKKLTESLKDTEAIWTLNTGEIYKSSGFKNFETK